MRNINLDLKEGHFVQAKCFILSSQDLSEENWDHHRRSKHWRILCHNYHHQNILSLSIHLSKTQKDWSLKMTATNLHLSSNFSIPISFFELNGCYTKSGQTVPVLQAYSLLCHLSCQPVFATFLSFNESPFFSKNHLEGSFLVSIAIFSFPKLHVVSERPTWTLVVQNSLFDIRSWRHQTSSFLHKLVSVCVTKWWSNFGPARVLWWCNKSWEASVDFTRFNVCNSSKQLKV